MGNTFVVNGSRIATTIIRVRKKGSFGKGSVQKSRCLEILENLEVLEFLENPHTVERIRPFSRDSREVRDFKDSRDSSCEKTPFVMTPFSVLEL